MLILRSLFFKNFQSGRYIHQCAPAAPDWSSLFLCIYRRRAFLRQTFLLHRNYRIHCCRLWPSVPRPQTWLFHRQAVCQKDNRCPLLMYHLRSEIHQPGIPGVGDKNSRITCFQITGKIKHVLSMTSVIIYVRKCLSEDRVQKFSHTG